MPFEYSERKKPIFLRRTISFRNLGFIYQSLNLNYEIGGSFDFDKKGKFLRSQLYPVNKLGNEIVLPDSLSVEFHTHPSRRLVQMPSLTDLIAQAKRSINNPKKFRNKYAQYRGALAIVFNHFGAITYKYNKKTLPTAKQKKEILWILISLKKDSIPNLTKQAKALESYGFEISIQTWAKIKKSGLYLKFCSRRYHRVAEE